METQKNKKRAPMPPPDATPEDIGEFWDTHSLADYWDETHEVEFQVNLKSRQDPSTDEAKATGPAFGRTGVAETKCRRVPARLQTVPTNKDGSGIRIPPTADRKYLTYLKKFGIIMVSY